MYQFKDVWRPSLFWKYFWNSVKCYRNHFSVYSDCLCCFRCILINGDIIMAASEKQRAEKIITVASQRTINCQQVQDLSTELNLSWCRPTSPNTDDNTTANKNTIQIHIWIQIQIQAQRLRINCQQVQDLSTQLNLSWCRPVPPWLKYKYKYNCKSKSEHKNMN